MIKSKPCKRPGCNNPAWSHGYCQNDQRLRTDEKWLRKLKEAEEKPKKVYTIPKTSKKYGAELAKYNKRVKEWKIENPFCKYPGCNKATSDNHHQIGRGKHLMDERYWFPACREHHDWAEANPVEAKKIGMSLNRLSK